MKCLRSVLFSMMLLFPCIGFSYQYQGEQDPNQWQGKNIQDLVNKWGEADQVMHARDGSSYYVYSTKSGTNYFASMTTNYSTSANNAADNFPTMSQTTDSSLECSTVFTTDNKGVIVKVWHQGNNCGGEWVQ